MATMIQDELYSTFLKVSGQQAAGLSDVTVTLADVLAQLHEAQAASIPQNAGASTAAPTPQTNSHGDTLSPVAAADVLAQLHEIQSASTPAPPAKSSGETLSPVISGDFLAQLRDMQSVFPPASAKAAAAPAAQANSDGDVLSSIASTVLKSGFGLAPLIGGLVSLFGSDAPAAPPPLVKYALPPGIDFQAAETGSGVSGLDYDQAGMPRTYAASSTSSRQTTSSNQTTSVPGSETNTAGGAPARPAPQITVNVQAMDARSFLDRSNEIALAVRDAMLNMNAINDVVNEL